MKSDVQIEPLLRSKRDVRRFLKVAYRVYAGDPYWVAPLLMDIERVFSDENPFFEHARMAMWVATRNGGDVGRIAAIVDDIYVKFHNDNAAFFGFFEAVDDASVSGALFDAAMQWAREQGARRMLGPMNPSTNDECGLLVDGFDSSPVFMMTYNPRYYMGLMTAAGFQKAKDLVAFYMDLSNSPLERLGRIAAKTRERHKDLAARPVLRKTLRQDLAKVKEVYNEAWSQNWGFVPMTDREIEFMADRLKPLFYEGLVRLVESPSGPVAFLLALPDYNEAIKPLRGRLATPRVLGFIPHLLGWRCPKRVRVITLGVKEVYRNHGLESVLLHEGLAVGAKAGFVDCEASWVLEDNVKMRKVIELFGARVYKTYRVYERDI